MNIRRRECLKMLAVAPLALQAGAREALAAAALPRKEAMWYAKLDKGTVNCQLCPRTCIIADGESGFCRARKNIRGTLYSLGYASPCAIHIDPIEKKPFFNYLPKTYSFSFASAGCSLRCKFCQNWEISQISPLQATNYSATPEQLVASAKAKGCRSIAYTYTEATSFYEFMLDTARLARREGLFNVYHSNGYTNPEPLKELCKYLDAGNIDLKGFSREYYRTMCEADLDPVLETLKTLRKSGVWVEITNLVVPGHNDNPQMIKGMAEWIRGNLGPDTPLHFSRFFPLYKLTHIAATPVPTLEKARTIALKAGLRYVYIGNVPGNAGENTFCPKCTKMLVRRSGFSVLENHVERGRCKFCSEKIAGVWTPPVRT